jgi:hypothetical protein
MHAPKRVSISMAATTLAVLAFSGAAMARGYDPMPAAHSYAGSWPVTVTGSNTNWTGCLTLTNEGGASLVIGSQRYPDGSYLVVNKIFVATIQAQGYGQNAGLLFIAPAMHKLNQGAYETVYGGSDFASGALAFGMKGGC